LAQKDLKRYIENWHGEVDSAAQYQALSKVEKSPQLSKVYSNLAEIEIKHRDFWENQITQAGGKVPPREPTWRAKVLIWVAQSFGPSMVLSTISGLEKADRNMYAPQPETKDTLMVSEEHGHDRVLDEILNTSTTGASGSQVAAMEGRHQNVGGNTLRAAVMGANDGLCSNMSLVMGVAGATVNNHLLLLTGLAGLLAGACSMALGEWLSVTNSNELAEREIRVEEQEFDKNPEGEVEELKLIYESKGMSPEEAEKLARYMLSDKARAMDTLAREELGLNPEDRGGNPWEAAGTSFLLFTAGALIPVSPFFFLSGPGAVGLSLGLSALALFGFGALGTIFTGKPVWFSGTRQLVLGLLAAALTYGLGHLLGVHLS
jgi:VIT1/CCC1 family predicted Fe2+/Mn2+ transporter